MHLGLLVPVLFWIKGCSTAQDPISGPNMVSGQEQGSLMVQCHYDPSWKYHKKYWCRGAAWSNCETLIQTDKSEQLVKKNRLSIRDNQTDFIVTVTMEDLRISDAGIYWCVIERFGSDHGFKVNVNIDPAPQTPPPVLTTLPVISTTTMFTVTTSVKETTSTFPGMSSYHTDDRPGGDHSDNDSDDNSGGLLDLSVLLPIISAVLLLLLLVASLFVWRMVRRQKKAAGSHSEQVSETLEGELCYANLVLQEPRTSPGSSGKCMSSHQAPQEKVEYMTMTPFPREEISYAALSLAALGQEPIYNNTSCFNSHIPSTSLEESAQYSTIKKP